MISELHSCQLDPWESEGTSVLDEIRGWEVSEERNSGHIQVCIFSKLCCVDCLSFVAHNKLYVYSVYHMLFQCYRRHSAHSNSYMEKGAKALHEKAITLIGGMVRYVNSLLSSYVLACFVYFSSPISLSFRSIVTWCCFFLYEVEPRQTKKWFFGIGRHLLLWLVITISFNCETEIICSPLSASLFMKFAASRMLTNFSP